MSLKLSRRDFVKATAVASASAMVLGAAEASFADEAADGATAGDDVKVIPSACRQCYGRCALFGTVENGRLTKIEGNPDLFSEGTLCGRAFAIPQEMYNPTRVRYPQRRVGEKGSGQWKRITWEEAYEEAAKKFTEIGEQYGWHTIAHQYGTGRDMLQFQAINKLWLELGSTATFGVGNLCWVGSYFTSQRLYGDETQYTGWDGNNTDCIVIWCRQERSRGYYDWLTVKRAQERGAKVVCVDPRFTCTASKADLWLPIRPGSDMALVLAFINEIMHSEKCATDFARQYTNAPFFIDEEGTGYQLRQSIMREGGNVELYPAWDEAHDQLIYWSGDWQNTAGVGGPKAFQWLDEAGNIVPDAKPALTTPDGAGREIEGKTYRTVWDILLEHVTPWTVERAAEFCELPADKIREAIDIYIAASPHACFTRGQKVEFSINTSGISQAFTIMMALAGNFDSKGGQNIGREPATGYDSFMFDVVPNKEGRMGERRKQTAMNIKQLSVCQNTGYQQILQADNATGELVEVTQNSGGQVIYGQQGGFGAVTTKAMAKGDPFQIHGYWQQTSEPILSIEGGKEIIEGFKNLDFFVNVDIFMTPSGELADIILPAAHPNEVDRVEWAHSGHGYPTSHTYLIRQPFHAPLGEAKDDMDICFEFAEYMGVDMYWKDKYEFFDYMVKGPETLPAELSCSSFEEFRERISVTGVEMTTVRNAPKYETGFMRKTSDFRPGFNTMYRGNKMGSVYRFPGTELPDGTVIPPHPQSDNGKMELWSEDLLLYGNGPLPMYIEPPITKKSREDLTSEYPFTLITGGRSHAFFHTEYRNSPWMREVHMFPTMDINPATAAKLGIEQDDWCWIETYVDRIRQRANLTEAIKPDTIHVEHDWWFPERAATDDLHGALDANCNILFENNGPYDPAVGTDNFGGLCKVYKAEEGAPDNICMTSEDLRIFLPLTREELAQDGQNDGVAMPVKGGN
ncbi:molybdopterin-dependent oxidoreductase [Adlercreutzia sp. R25]|uniref:Molybdopterin-dependent oxidoreductase n=1 Tax=Adlercreutzia shanghongiae TaxID=3111773 RepID=A0ABU6IWG3_9ACTN|nr:MULTISPECIES: molybdopterin-dependent oxidoreductase [unclassified Adlercreutzia]MEC4273579.1 molybdopterin-dependent oxidoreductase [Adlercreutzia sp. R25]MEC4294177.1 molybdopterin-dependent oxidoreductase [Adlercreutzia sp. R22]